MTFWQKSGILGMNARNLLYLARYNSRANKKFADDKLFTKNFLESRGIGVAKLYRAVKNHADLTSEFFDSLPESFVVKPNRGFAGGGIVVIVRRKNGKFITAGGKKMSEDTLRLHCITILDGKYSISGTHDTAIFEEFLSPHPDFRKLTEIGLPDVRVIVFNRVPVMAMLRVPTAESDGKANMELGAIGMGIDIGTGRTTGGARFSKFLRKMPNGEPTEGFLVPFWDEILESCARTQDVTKIGFLGCDFVITKSGVKILELNARAGLKIQIANRAPLRARLEKVGDIKISSWEDGVAAARTLFSEKSTISTQSPEKPVIGIFENVILNAEPPRHLLAKIDLAAEKNTISAKFFDESAKTLDITIAEKRLKLPVEKGRVVGADLTLGGKFLHDFYIDPNKKIDQKTQKNFVSSVDEKILKNVDEKLAEIDSQIKLLSWINPQNLAEQKSLFLAHSSFSPRFFYRKCDLDFDILRSDLKKIPEVNHELFPLYRKKIEELESKLDLIEGRDSSEFFSASKRVFGGVNASAYRWAVDFIAKNQKNCQPDNSKELDTKFATEVLKKYCIEHKLPHWKIKIVDESVADIQITKKNTILLKKGAHFRENRLRALLAHEIGTHVFRFENGKLQELRIFERGTAGYLQTEEGLAIWNQNSLKLNLGEKFLTPALLVIAIHLAEKMGFCDLFQYLKHTFEIDDDFAWKLCVKSKRGMSDTAKKGAFTKDSIYFLGHREVEKFVKKGGKIEDLYIGKITIGDLKILKNFEKLQPARFLP